MSTFSRLWIKPSQVQYPEYKPNFVDKSLKVIKTNIFIVLTHSQNSFREKSKHGFEKQGKKYANIVRNTASEEIFALVDEVDSALEDDIDNLKKDSGTELELEESLEKELDSDNEPLNLLVP